MTARLRNIRDMIREPTVLILGAGASQPYGFPLGGELKDRILVDLFMPDSDTHLQKVLADSGLHQPGDIKGFRERLDGSGLGSIDLFLEGLEPDDVYVQIGKVAIAHTILWHENHERLVGREKAKRHWYEHVWNRMRPGASTKNLHENGLRIITFNYESSFEYYFTTAIENSFRDLGSWTDALALFQSSVPVVHVHGEVGEVESFCVNENPFKHEIVGEAADRIRIVHDPIAGDDPRYREARELISTAQRVAFVGFGYHPANLTHLNLRQCLPKAIMDQGGPFASTCEMSAMGIDAAREAIGVPARFAPSGLDALGFFEEFLALT